MLKGISSILIFMTITCLCNNILFSQAPPAKNTTEDIYKAYEKYSPKDMMDYVQKSIDYYQEVGEKKAFAEFDLPYPSKWNKFPIGYHILVMSCEEYRAVAHTLAIQFPVFKQKGFAKQFKDVNGKKTYIELCEGIKRNSEGYWVVQKQFWPETRGALLMGGYLKPIPGTSYFGHIYYPTRKYTAEDLNRLVPK